MATGLTIQPDGTLSFDIVNVYMQDFAEELMDQNCEGVVMFPDGNVVIHRTEMFTIPKLDEIDAKIKQEDAIRATGEKIKRGEGITAAEYRNLMLRAVKDIQLVTNGTDIYYYTGDAGSTLKFGVENANHLYHLSGAKTRFAEILEWLNVYFVKYNQFTVLPFPFKYLREYLGVL